MEENEENNVRPLSVIKICFRSMSKYFVVLYEIPCDLSKSFVFNESYLFTKGISNTVCRETKSKTRKTVLINIGPTMFRLTDSHFLKTFHSYFYPQKFSTVFFLLVIILYLNKILLGNITRMNCCLYT